MHIRNKARDLNIIILFKDGFLVVRSSEDGIFLYFSSTKEIGSSPVDFSQHLVLVEQRVGWHFFHIGCHGNSELDFEQRLGFDSLEVVGARHFATHGHGQFASSVLDPSKLAKIKVSILHHNHTFTSKPISSLPSTKKKIPDYGTR